jgi:hypothetical protein
MTMIGSKASFDKLLAAYESGCKQFYGGELDITKNIRQVLKCMSADWEANDSISKAMSFFVANCGKRTWYIDYGRWPWHKDYASIEDATAFLDDGYRKDAVVGDDVVLVLEDYEFGCETIIEVTEKLKPKKTLVFYLP